MSRESGGEDRKIRKRKGLFIMIPYISHHNMSSIILDHLEILGFVNKLYIVVKGFIL